MPTTERTYKDWHCPKCGHEVTAVERPEPIKWTDGHTCYFAPGPAPADARL